MPRPKINKATKEREIHVRVTHDDYVALTARAKEDARSMTAQARFYIRRGIEQGTKK